MKLKGLFIGQIILISILFVACSSSSPRFTDQNEKKEDKDPVIVEDKTQKPNLIKIEKKDEKIITIPREDIPNVEEEIFTTPVLKTVEGVASYYAHKFHGRKTANGEIYDMNGLTAAHRTYPFGTIIRVTNIQNDSSVVVRINDRGPFIAGRIIDLSYGAAKLLDIIPTGTATVKLEILEWGQ